MFEARRLVKQVRYSALDSWRGICALAVALFHFPIACHVRASPFVGHAYLFVDFFFVLSGFVIATTYDGRIVDNESTWQFVVRRFGRLWPLHVFILALFVAASLVKGEVGGDARHSVASIFTNLALIHGLGIHRDVTWNGPSWSISVEFFLYLCFAALARVPGKYYIFGGLIMASIAVLRFVAPHGMASTVDYGFFRGLAGFFTGALLSKLPRRQFGTLWEILTVGLVVAFVYFGYATTLSPLVFAIAVYVFAGSHGAIAGLLNTPPALKLGQWSYSLYMVHALIVAMLWAASSRLHLTQAGHMLIAPGGWGDAAVLPYLALIIATSSLTYRFVEDPARRYFNGLARGSRVVAPRPADSRPTAE